MNYTLGKTSFAITGVSPLAQRLGDMLRMISSQDGRVELEFRFVDSLPAWSEPYVRLDNYEVGQSRFRVRDRVWLYEVAPSGGQVVVQVAPRRFSPLAELLRSARKSWRYFHTHGRGGYLHLLKRLVYDVYMPITQLLLLRSGASFSHCGAIERDGRVVLLPAGGGVGKTTLVGRYLKLGWRFLADDFCVIGSDGTASYHPLPMHIYKFHRRHCPDVVRQMLAAAAPWDRALWSALAPLKRGDALVRWVSPDSVFGQEKLARQGRVTSAIYMHRRQGSSEFALEHITPARAAAMMASTALYELNELDHMSIVLGACREFDFVPPIGALYERMAGVFASALAQAECYALAIPADATADDLQARLEELIRV